MKPGKADPRRIPLLDKPGLLTPRLGFFSRFSVYAALLLLGFAGAFGSLYTGLDFFIDPVPVLVVGILLALLCAAQFSMARGGGWIAVPMALVWAGIVWRRFGDLLQGALRTANVILSAYRDKFGLALPTLQTTFATNTRSSQLMTFFALMLAYPFFWLLALLLIRFHSAMGCFLLTGTFFLIPLAISFLPQAWALAAILLFWMFLLLAAPSMGQRRRLVEDRRRYRASGEAFLRPAALLLLPMLLIGMVGVYAVFPRSRYQRPPAVAALRDGLTHSGDLTAALQKSLGVPSRVVDLAELENPQYTGETVMQISKVRSSGSPAFSGLEYLKSFSGSVYTGHSWENFTGMDARQATALSPDGFAQTLYGAYAQNYDSGLPQGSYTLSVKDLRENPDTLYLPYGLFPDAALPDAAQYYQDGYLAPSRMGNAPNEYAFTTAPLPYGDDYSSGMEMFFRLGRISQNDDLKMDIGVTAGSIRSVDAADRYAYPEAWLRLLDGTSRSILLHEKNYADFVYDRYTALPDGMDGWLDRFRAQHRLSLSTGMGMSSAQEQRNDLIRRIRELFTAEYTYTLTPEAAPQEEDFVRYFLSESKEGFCVHFASAAVLLLRSAGVPARFAQGYAVSPDASGSWTNVPDYCAHAWVEVYWGGAGWVPVEVTPAQYIAASPEELAQGAEGTGTSGDDGTPAPQEEEDPVSSPEDLASDAPEPSGVLPAVSPSPPPVAAGKSFDPRPLLWGHVLPGLLAAIGASRRVRLRRWAAKVAQAEPNRAALLLYQRILRMTAFGAARLHGFSDPPQEILLLVQKARFSNHALSPEELARLADYAQALSHRLEETLPRLTRLRCKYLLAWF